MSEPSLDLQPASNLPSFQSALPFVVVAVCAALLFFYRLGAMGLLDPEEGRYAEIPREMIERGDWITPRLNYMRYLEKPPLLYWCVAGSYQLFGISEWSARLGSALPALIGVLAVYAWGRRVINPRAGLFSALILMTSPEYFALARALGTDMLFTSLLSIGLLLGYRGALGDESSKQCYRWMWVALAAAVLAKTPVVAFLALGILGLYFAIARQPRQLLRIEWPTGLFVLVLVVAPWFAIVSLRNTDFNHFYWVDQHWQRYFTDKSRLTQGPLYYAWVAMWGFLPWTLGLLALAIQHLRQKLQGRLLPAHVGFLWSWAAVILVFFTASSAKLTTYILPMYPALALLGGGGMDAWLRGLPAKSRQRLWASVPAGAAAITAVFLLSFHDRPVVLWFASFAPRSVVLSQRAARRAHMLQPCETLRPLARIIEREWRAGDLVAEYKWYGPSLTFYTRQRHLLIGDWNELNWAKNRDGGGGYFLEGERDLLRLLRGPRRIFCVMQRKTLQRELGALRNDIKMQRADRDLVLVSNRASPDSGLPPTNPVYKLKPSIASKEE